MFRKTKFLMIGFILILLISACGSAATQTPTSVAATDSSVPTENPQAASNSIVIQHTMGEVTLDKPAVRVVALEWTYVEDLLALGIQPVGVADIEGYNDWVNIPVELGPDVVDVGFRGEPNLETIASLKPDLIIDTEDSIVNYYDKLAAIAPTLAFNPYSADENSNQFDEMRTTFLAIADAVGKHAEGEQTLANMDKKISEGHAQIESAGLTGEKFVLSQMFSWENAVYVRLFTTNGMATQIVEQLGLKNGWSDGFQQYGFTEVSVEKLPELGDLHYFYVVNADDQVMNLDTVSPIWKSLPFVKSGKAYPLGGDTWLFGGPLSAEVIVDIVVGQLVK